MRVESGAGAFELKFERIEPGNGDIVLTGQMGVWEAKTHMSISEFFAVIRMAMAYPSATATVTTMMARASRGQQNSVTGRTMTATLSRERTAM